MGVITIDKDDREVGDEQGSFIRIQIATNYWHRFDRNKDETDKAMTVRVQAKVNKLRAAAAAAEAAATAPPTAGALAPRERRSSRGGASDSGSQCSGSSRLTGAVSKRPSSASRGGKAAAQLGSVLDDAMMATALRAKKPKPEKKRHPKPSKAAHPDLMQAEPAAQPAVPPVVKRLASAASDVSMGSERSPMSTAGGEPGPSVAQPGVRLPDAQDGAPAPAPAPAGDSSDDEGAHRPPSPPKAPPPPPANQSDSSSCGVWLQVARDAWLAYVASASCGTRTFPAFLIQRFEAAGAQHLTGLRGTARSTAEKANVALILEQRADMRGRLVQAALADKLPWGQARLAGFAPATAVDLDDFDDPVPE